MKVCEGNYSSFLGLGLCVIDSISVIFPNEKGYECTLGNPPPNDHCFEGRNPIFGEGFEHLGSNRYQFTITQEDFLNAKDLD